MGSDFENEKGTSVPVEGAELANAAATPVVDAETEKKLLRKLDIRIIPMVMWIYLMNFMDRGISTPEISIVLLLMMIKSILAMPDYTAWKRILVCKETSSNWQCRSSSSPIV